MRVNTRLVDYTIGVDIILYVLSFFVLSCCVVLSVSPSCTGGPEAGSGQDHGVLFLKISTLTVSQSVVITGVIPFFTPCSFLIERTG